MTKLSWDEGGSHLYEAGVDRGVFYPKVGPGVPWNGLISIEESDSETEQSVVYVDGSQAKTQLSLGSFTANLDAYTYPDAFQEYDGIAELAYQQRRKSFDLCYRTRVGNDVEGVDHGYKLHLVYNALATPTNKDYTTASSVTDAMVFSWDISTTPILIPGLNPISHLIVDSPAYPWVYTALEDVLYGTPTTHPRFPTIEEVFQIFEDASILKITDHGDGTWTAEGSEEIISMINPTTFEITWPSAVYLDEDTYTISSL